MILRSILFACLALGAQGTPQTVKIACFGDSNVEGRGVDGQPWSKQLRALLGTGYFATSNFGGSGKTVVDYGDDRAYIASDDYKLWKDEEVPCAREAPYSVGIVALGTNDAKTANLAAYNQTTFRAAYEALIDAIVADANIGDQTGLLKLLVLCTAPPIATVPNDQDAATWDNESAEWVNTTLRDQMHELRDWADDKYSGVRVVLVDFYEALSTATGYPGAFYPDDDKIHPNREGHAVMAHALEAEVQAWCAASGECDTTLACGDDSLFYPLKGDTDDWEIDNPTKNPYNVTGFATFGGITYGGSGAENVVECGDEKCFEDAVERNGYPKNVPLIVKLTADIVTTEKNEPSGDSEGSLTIDGQGHTISYGTGEDALGIRAPNVVILNVHFKNVDPGNDKTAVKIRDGAHHVVIQSCTFSCDSSSNCDDADRAVEVEDATFITIDKCKFEKIDRGVSVSYKCEKDEKEKSEKGDRAGRVTISESCFKDVRRETPRAEEGWVHILNSVIEGGGDSSSGMVLTDPMDEEKLGDAKAQVVRSMPEILVEGCSFKNVKDNAYKDRGGNIAERDVFMDAESRAGADEPAAPAPEPNATARRRLDIPAARLLLIDDDERKPGVDCTGRGRDRPDAPVGVGEDVAGCAAEFTVEALRAEYYPRERIYNAGEVGATIDVTLLRNGTVNADHNPYDVQGFAGAPWAGITYGGSDGGHVYCGNETCLENYLETKKARERGIAVEGAHTIHLTQDMEIGNEQLRRVKDKTIEGHGFTLKFKSSASLFLVLNCSNLVFRDIRFEHDGAASAGADVFYVRDSHHIVWDGCTFDYGECDDDKCDEAIHMAAPATFLTVQRTRFIGYIQGIDMSHGGRYASKDEYGRYGDDQNSPHVTFYACYFENPHSRQPKVTAGRLHMVNCLWIGTPEYSFYGVRAQATTTALGTAQPQVLVESAYVEGVDLIWTMTATSEEDNDDVIAEDVKGVIAEANCNLDAHSRVDTEVAFFKSDLTWCVPYSYWRMDPFDCNHVTDVKEGAGAPWVGPSMAPTPLPPVPSLSWCPPYEYSPMDPTNETEVDRICAAAGAPVDASTDAPTAGPTPQPAGAPPTDDSTHAPTAEPTPQACDSPEKFYPNTDHQLADEGSGPDGWKLTSEHSQKNPYSVVGFAAWPHAGITYGGFYGGNVTCYDADCIEDALEKKSPLIIHLGQDINLGSARYKIRGKKDHDDKTLEGHGFTLKYSGDGGEAPLFTDDGVSNLVFRNVRFENTGKDSPAIQIRDDANHVVLDQCTFACSEPGKCGYAVTVEAPATFVTIQRCLFDQVRKGIRVRNKAGDNGAGRLTVVECYFRNCEKESPDTEVGWIHMASNVVEGGGDGDGMIKTDPDNGGVPELLVDGGRLSVSTGDLYKKKGGLIAAVPGITNSDPAAPDAPEDLSWCVPYDYTPIDGFDDAAVETIKENAGAHPDEPGSEPTAEPTAEPTPMPTVAPTTPQPSSTPTERPSSEPTPAPTTPMPTPGPTMEPTAEPFEPAPTCPVVKLIDSAACPEFCPPDCKDPKIGPGMQCSGDGVCASDDQGVFCTCKHLRRRLLANPEEDQVYVFDVTEFGECVPCGAGGACDVGECVPDTRRRGLRFGISTSGCCRGA